jgi:hypothetical protein
MSKTLSNPPAPEASDLAWIELVRKQVSSLQFGVVQITVHQARVTQIERTERVRLDPPALLTFSHRDHAWRE